MEQTLVRITTSKPEKKEGEGGNHSYEVMQRSQMPSVAITVYFKRKSIPKKNPPRIPLATWSPLTSTSSSAFLETRLKALTIPAVSNDTGGSGILSLLFYPSASSTYK